MPCSRHTNVFHDIRTQQQNQQQHHRGETNQFVRGEVDYYNDLPGKSPPEFSNAGAPSTTGSERQVRTNVHTREATAGFRQRPTRGKFVMNIEFCVVMF